MLFLPDSGSGEASRITAGTAFTDNLGNAYRVSRLMSHRFPVCVSLMELSQEVDCEMSWLQPQWVARQLSRSGRPHQRPVRAFRSEGVRKLGEDNGKHGKTISERLFETEPW